MPSQLANPVLAHAAKLQGQELRRGRMANFLSQPQAAEVCGVPESTYQSWEYGKRTAPVATREYLVSLWGLDQGLLGLDPEHTCPCCGRLFE